MSDIETRFKNALKFIQTPSPESGSISNSMKLKFYGLFKQATEGPCKGTAPSKLKIVERAKYDAWKACGNISKEDAMKTYVNELTKATPGWETPKAKL